MANVRVIVVSGRLAELISAAYCHIIGETRKRAIKSAAEYQHRPDGFYTVPFASVYSEDAEKASAARHEIYFNPAITPEMELSSYILERAIQINEVDLTVEGMYTLNGIIIFRRDGYGGGSRKIRIAIVYGVASNGNIYKRDVIILSDKNIQPGEVDESEQAGELSPPYEDW